MSRADGSPDLLRRGAAVAVIAVLANVVIALAVTTVGAVEPFAHLEPVRVGLFTLGGVVVLMGLHATTALICYAVLTR